MSPTEQTDSAQQAVPHGVSLLAHSKTKLVCTIGQASDSPAMLLQMLLAGMNIARLNFSHGDFAWHQKTIEKLRSAGRMAGKPVTILADMPGPKLRIGTLATEGFLEQEGID